MFFHRILPRPATRVKLAFFVRERCILFSVQVKIRRPIIIFWHGMQFDPFLENGDPVLHSLPGCIALPTVNDGFWRPFNWVTIYLEYFKSVKLNDV